MKKLFFIFLISFLSCVSYANISIVKSGKAISRILINKNDNIDEKAALLLNDFIKRITGTELPVLEYGKNKAKKGDIVIGNFDSGVSFSESSFAITTKDGIVHISGHGKGRIYAVVTLLEDYWGVKYYAQNACSFNYSENLTIPSDIKLSEKPSFKYRQTQSYSLSDTIYRLWHRLDEPEDIFAGGLWVHTFDRILPSSEFGKSHPEYYSFINGQRRPGAASQWCLTNPDVFEIVSKKVDSIFKKNPGKNIISVSQNDGNNTNCHCEKCKEIDDREGSPSGSLIYFLNKLAERFPDKQFSTLAYLYSVTPPKYIKPLPNVNIMLCDIDCMREVTLTENPSGQSFVKDMEAWAKISNNIFVWDYGINFDNYVSPFPNFHILQPNMKLFKKNNATFHFSQIAGSKGGDFSELRSYLVAKLLWNVEINVDSVMISFLDGYYGKAGHYLYQYIKLREGALLGSKIPLWIYDTPITHKNGMLNAGLIKRYRSLFDQAEESVKDNTTFLNRVKETRLAIQYAELEIARTNIKKDVDYIKEQLDLFRNNAAKLGVSVLNERNNTIEEYYQLYLKRNFMQGKQSLASGAKVQYILPPSAGYMHLAYDALTDGLYGGATFNEGWVGWEGKDADFIIDLGKVQKIKSVETDFLHKLGAWILLPKNISCYTSVDGNNFKLMGSKSIPEDRDAQVKYVNIPIKPEQETEARYVRLKVETIGLCPPWHYGVGYPAWFFIDEVNVY